MQKIFCLVDYNGVFESKHKPNPYGSGFDLNILKERFDYLGYDLEYLHFSELDFRSSGLSKMIFLYTSSEDPGFEYKSFIEDHILALELAGAFVIPAHIYLRANNNKVFMEILRDLKLSDIAGNITSDRYGSLDEIQILDRNYNYPLVYKSAAGAISSGVGLATSKSELLSKIGRISDSKGGLYFRFKELVRHYKYAGYRKISRFRRKFVLQNFIPNLKNDWKIYFFGEKLYIWYRFVRDNDFRASGSGKFLFNEDVPVPSGILDFAKEVYDKLNIPFVSMDIAYNGVEFYLLEFQCLYFGKNGHAYSKYYFSKVNGEWIKIENTTSIEQVYADSVDSYIKKMNYL